MMADPPAGLPRYRLLTGPDDDDFCNRVSDALALGYALHASPAIATGNGQPVVAQAVVWPDHAWPGAVSWLVELSVETARLDDFGTLTAEMTAAASREPGVLAYERYVDTGGDSIVVYDRYADSTAALAHLDQFTKTFAARFEEMVERKRFLVMGPASSALRARLGPMGARFHEQLAGDLSK